MDLKVVQKGWGSEMNCCPPVPYDSFFYSPEYQLWCKARTYSAMMLEDMGGGSHVRIGTLCRWMWMSYRPYHSETEIFIAY